MKKNKNGFFLAETIIMIALVTTVIAFLYPNISKLYENYNNRLNHYDQVQDIYVLRAIEEYINSDAEIYKCFIDRVKNSTFTEVEEGDPNLIRIYYDSRNYLAYRGKKEGKEVFEGECDKYLPSMRIQNDTNTLIYSNLDLSLEYGYVVDSTDAIATVPHEIIEKPNDTSDLGTEGKNVIELFTQLNDLYISKYMDTPTSSRYDFNKYLRRMKKTTNSPNAYRLIGTFRTRDNEGNIVDERFASIKILLEDNND